MAKTKPSNAAVAAALKLKIAMQVRKAIGKGLNAGRIFLTARVKEAVSVPAPRKIIRGLALPGKKLGPILGYRAATRAVKGAPPRKLSGRLRTSVTSKMDGDYRAVIGANAKSDAGFNYPKHLELKGGHPFIQPAVKKFKAELRKIIGQEVKLVVGK